MVVMQISIEDMLLLQRAADAEDLEGFICLVNSMDWQPRSVEDYLRAIDLALSVGAHLTARQLSQEGGARFPDHPEMAKYAYMLSPPKILRADLPPDPGIAQNTLWLRQHREEYCGQWVALRDGELLVRGNTFQEVRQQVGPLKNTRILAIKVY